MNCPKCKSPTEVLQTKTTGEGFHQRVRRRHRCLHCKERYSSVEKYVIQNVTDVANRAVVSRVGKEIPRDAIFSEDRDPRVT